MKGVQCYELFGGIALKNHAFSFFIDSHFVLSHSFSDDLQLRMPDPLDKISELFHSMQ